MDAARLLGLTVEDPAHAAWADTRDETAELAEGAGRASLSFTEHGVTLNLNPQGVVTAVYFVPASRTGTLPEGLRFDMSRARVVERLGAPSLSKAETGGAFGLPGWDRYDRQDHSLHVQYAPGEGSVGLITLLPPQPPPRTQA